MKTRQDFRDQALAEIVGCAPDMCGNRDCDNGIYCDACMDTLTAMDIDNRTDELQRIYTIENAKSDYEKMFPNDNVIEFGLEDEDIRELEEAFDGDDEFWEELELAMMNMEIEEDWD